MNSLTEQIGTFYVVATPIGNLQDISQRALTVLQSVDLILAEDCRHSKKLLMAYGIQTPMQAFHAHNEQKSVDLIVSKLKLGQSLALISDAGTPLISDPGQTLVTMLRQLAMPVVPIPGPCALITALSGSGLMSARFIFEGFLSVKAGARQKRLRECAHETRTVIFYEAPHRIVRFLEDALVAFGEDRPAVIARELTKIHETFICGSLRECLAQVSTTTENQLGEFVVLISGLTTERNSENPPIDVDALLRMLLPHLPIKQLATEVAALTGLKKNDLYQRALELMAVGIANENKQVADENNDEENT